MILWILILLLLAAVTVAGYYQGAVRAVLTLIGLLLGTILSFPLAGATHGLLSLTGIKHPVLLKFLGPLVILVLLFLVFKGAGFWVHQKVMRFFKYRTDDETRIRFERLNQQLGLAIGAANGVVLAALLCIGIYVVGYFSVQVAAPDKDPWYLNLVNAVSRDLDTTGFYRALSPFMPAAEFYYDATDVLGLLYRSPQLQNRLSRYPLFLRMAEEDRFQALGKDKAFHDYWKGNPSFVEMAKHDSIKPFIGDANFYMDQAELLSENLKDLKIYLETGKSPQYGDQNLVDRWEINLGASYSLARRIKPNMTMAERKYLRDLYEIVWENAILTAYLDETTLLKNKSETGKPQSVKGTWKHEYGTKYTITMRDKGKWDEFETLVETNQVTLIQDKLALVFEN